MVSISPDYFSLVIEFLLSFIATVLGVFVAFYLSIHHEREKDRSEEALAQQRKNEEVALAKERAISAIRLELDENSKDIQKIGASPTPVVSLRTGAYQSAIANGVISLFSPEIQTVLSTTYLRIRRLELLAQKLVGMSGASTTLAEFDKSLNYFKLQFDAERDGIIGEIRETLKKLGP